MNNKSFKVCSLVIAIMFVILASYGCKPNSNGNNRGTYITLPTKTQLGQLPRDAAIVFLSSRWHDRSGQDIPGPLQIYAMNEDGGQVTQITYDYPDGTFEHAAVSFDRNFIVANLVDDNTRNSSLWIYDLENKTKARLVPGFYSAGTGGVDWSPDGYIYFAARETSPYRPEDLGRQDIFRIRPDGTDLQRLTHTTEIAEVDVSVSEDGTMVAYIAVTHFMENGQEYEKSQVWAMNSDGTNQRVVYEGPDGPNWEENGLIGIMGGADPEFSSDNSQLVFSRVNPDYANFPEIPGMNTAHDLFVINTDGTGIRRLTSEGAVNIIADWHNDKILFTEYNDLEDYVGLVTINPDGSGMNRLESGLPRVWDGGRHGKWIP